MSLGAQGSSQSQQSQQGFSDLPSEIQNPFKALAIQAQSFLPGTYGSTPGTQGMTVPQGSALTPADTASYTDPNAVVGNPKVGGAIQDKTGAPVAPAPAATLGTPSAGTNFGSGIGSNIFTPLGQTAGETQAYNAINQGFTPTASSISSDIAMQQNPFDQSVIDGINRQGQGANSVLQQNLNAAGQFGSNRSALGANDIDLSRLQQIGQFEQGQYNTNLNNALTTLPTSRASDAATQLAAGGAQRQLNQQTQQAPITALQSIAQILGILPTNSGTSSGSGSSFGFDGGVKFSDSRIKENIEPIGTESGWPVYAFNYIGDAQRYIGVMAQDVEKMQPDAVMEINGIKAVDYSKIGVEFRRAA